MSEIIIKIFGSIYIYLTDFIINLANITGGSYYELNFLFFCVLYPLIFLTSIVYFLVQKLRLYKVKRKVKR
ncbi:putative inner membrane protein translocase component YidC [Leadbetterella byssophila DSM 17132]|uniref:Inner membrane protein translocase component YidC n=1 Tax=Leadbetterella byssophila (strain DSM 17132 / JCM 16389 / KACC 11308 / NBRC 106382 / 4M15) TaxID=649349 RepID=E4RVD4_LEAB4|nr:putative inner membrane protein translocase component YidC [Leadbetterella byssophila DSM 17132]